LNGLFSLERMEKMAQQVKLATLDFLDLTVSIAPALRGRYIGKSVVFNRRYAYDIMCLAIVAVTFLSIEWCVVIGYMSGDGDGTDKETAERKKRMHNLTIKTQSLLTHSTASLHDIYFANVSQQLCPRVVTLKPGKQTTPLCAMNIVGQKHARC
jgi:hypothetical protein